MIDDLVFFCHNHHIGLKITLGYAMRMFNAYQRKYSKIFEALDKNKGNTNRKGSYTPPKRTPPAHWFMEERKEKEERNE